MNRREMFLFSGTALGDGLVLIPRKAPFFVGEPVQHAGIDWRIAKDNGDGTFNLFNYPVGLERVSENDIDHITGDPRPFSPGI